MGGGRDNTASASWSALSDRELKENFAPVDGRAILERLASIPIEIWNFKHQNPSLWPIGPMARDFYAAFAVGRDNRRISTLDADGVALAAIQGLYEVVKEKDSRIAALEARLAALEAAIAGVTQSPGATAGATDKLALSVPGENRTSTHKTSLRVAPRHLAPLAQKTGGGR